MNALPPKSPNSPNSNFDWKLIGASGLTMLFALSFRSAGFVLALFAAAWFLPSGRSVGSTGYLKLCKRMFQALFVVLVAGAILLLAIGFVYDLKPFAARLAASTLLPTALDRVVLALQLADGSLSGDLTRKVSGFSALRDNAHQLHLLSLLVMLFCSVVAPFLIVTSPRGTTLTAEIKAFGSLMVFGGGLFLLILAIGLYTDLFLSGRPRTPYPSMNGFAMNLALWPLATIYVVFSQYVYRNRNS